MKFLSKVRYLRRQILNFKRCLWKERGLVIFGKASLNAESYKFLRGDRESSQILRTDDIFHLVDQGKRRVDSKSINSK